MKPTLKRLAGIGLVAVLAFSTTACASSDGDAGALPTQSALPSAEDPEVEPVEVEPDPPKETKSPIEDLVVVEQSVFKVRDYWKYVVILENPNTDKVFATSTFGVEITVEALDQTGVILDSDSNYIGILPGRAAVQGTFFDVGEHDIASLEVRGPQAVESNVVRAEAGSSIGTYTVADVTGTVDRYNWVAVSGTVTSGFENEQEMVPVVVLVRTPDGAIVDVDSDYIDRLPSGGTARFEVQFMPDNPYPEGTTYEAYVQFG